LLVFQPVVVDRGPSRRPPT